MNPERTKLKQEIRAEQASAQEQFQRTESQAQVKEFATVDDLLRFDSEQNPVPPEVADRLGRSLEAEPKPEKPWYKKLFGN
jgi:hypothetical protein